MRTHRAALLFRLSLFSIVLGCGGGAATGPAAPAPLRPEPIAAKATGNTRTDCDPVEPERQDAARPFDERSIDEAQRLAEDGAAKVREADSGDMPMARREGLTTEAVSAFLTALAADPYNVKATYGLAATYARIGRKQCSINLLERLLQMRDHASRKSDIARALDRLLGRNGQALDRDFNELRADNRFRAMIQRMCDGTNDANCVLGRSN